VSVSAFPLRKRVVLLGATGSIGRNALRVIAAHPEQLELVAVAAHGQWEKLAAIAREFGVRQVKLKLSKPGAVRGAKAVGVIIERSRAA